MKEIYDVDEVITKVNRVVDKLYYDLIEAYDWDNISKTGVYSEDCWKVDNLTDEQLKTLMAKKQELDKIMIPTAMQVCHMEDRDIEHFAGFARLGKHYVLRALIKLNNMERARDLGFISKSIFSEVYVMQELEKMLKKVETAHDCYEVKEFIKKNKLPEKAYSMLKDLIVKKLLKSEDVSLEDKLAMIESMGGAHYIDNKHTEYDYELLKEIKTCNEEEERKLFELTNNLNIGLKIALKTKNIEVLWPHCGGYDEVVEHCKNQLKDKKIFVNFDKLVAEQDLRQYLWFVHNVIDNGLEENINWELVNNTVISHIEDLDETDLFYVFKHKGFDREKITEALLQCEQIDMISAMDNMLDPNYLGGISKKDKKLIAKLFFAKCEDAWDLYNEFAKFAPEYSEKIYKKMLEHKVKFDKLTAKTKRTKEQDELLKRFVSALENFEQDHPEVLDQGLQQ